MDHQSYTGSEEEKSSEHTSNSELGDHDRDLGQRHALAVDSDTEDLGVAEM